MPARLDPIIHIVEGGTGGGTGGGFIDPGYTNPINPGELIVNKQLDLYYTLDDTPYEQLKKVTRVTSSNPLLSYRECTLDIFKGSYSIKISPLFSADNEYSSFIFGNNTTDTTCAAYGPKYVSEGASNRFDASSAASEIIEACFEHNQNLNGDPVWIPTQIPGLTISNYTYVNIGNTFIGTAAHTDLGSGSSAYTGYLKNHPMQGNYRYIPTFNITKTSDFSLTNNQISDYRLKVTFKPRNKDEITEYFYLQNSPKYMSKVDSDGYSWIGLYEHRDGVKTFNGDLCTKKQFEIYTEAHSPNINANSVGINLFKKSGSNWVELSQEDFDNWGATISQTYKAQKEIIINLKFDNKPNVNLKLYVFNYANNPANGVYVDREIDLHIVEPQVRFTDDYSGTEEIIFDSKNSNQFTLNNRNNYFKILPYYICKNQEEIDIAITDLSGNISFSFPQGDNYYLNLSTQDNNTNTVDYEIHSLPNDHDHSVSVDFNIKGIILNDIEVILLDARPTHTSFEICSANECEDDEGDYQASLFEKNKKLGQISYSLELDPSKEYYIKVTLGKDLGDSTIDSIIVDGMGTPACTLTKYTGYSSPEHQILKISNYYYISSDTNWTNNDTYSIHWSFRRTTLLSSIKEIDVIFTCPIEFELASDLRVNKQVRITKSKNISDVQTVPSRISYKELRPMLQAGQTYATSSVAYLIGKHAGQTTITVSGDFGFKQISLMVYEDWLDIRYRQKSYMNETTVNNNGTIILYKKNNNTVSYTLSIYSGLEEIDYSKYEFSIENKKSANDNITVIDNKLNIAVNSFISNEDSVKLHIQSPTLGHQYFAIRCIEDTDNFGYFLNRSSVPAELIPSNWTFNKIPIDFVIGNADTSYSGAPLSSYYKGHPAKGFNFSNFNPEWVKITPFMNSSEYNVLSGYKYKKNSTTPKKEISVADISKVAGFSNTLSQLAYKHNRENWNKIFNEEDNIHTGLLVAIYKFNNKLWIRHVVKIGIIERYFQYQYATLGSYNNYIIDTDSDIIIELSEAPEIANKKALNFFLQGAGGGGSCADSDGGGNGGGAGAFIAVAVKIPELTAAEHNSNDLRNAIKVCSGFGGTGGNSDLGYCKYGIEGESTILSVGPVNGTAPANYSNVSKVSASIRASGGHRGAYGWPASQQADYANVRKVGSIYYRCDTNEARNLINQQPDIYELLLPFDRSTVYFNGVETDIKIDGARDERWYDKSGRNPLQVLNNSDVARVLFMRDNMYNKYSPAILYGLRGGHRNNIYNANSPHERLESMMTYNWNYDWNSQSNTSFSIINLTPNNDDDSWFETYKYTNQQNTVMPFTDEIPDYWYTTTIPHGKYRVDIAGKITFGGRSVGAGTLQLTYADDKYLGACGAPSLWGNGGFGGFAGSVKYLDTLEEFNNICYAGNMSVAVGLGAGGGGGAKYPGKGGKKANGGDGGDGFVKILF